MPKKKLADLCDLILKLPASLQPPPQSTPVLAVSGGRDSILLLHLFDRLHREEGFAKPVVFHLDHCLRESSKADLDLVHKECRERDISLYFARRAVVRLARRMRRGVEESGRLLRYRLLARLVHKLQPAYALTAHHADDYLESLLIHLIRGGGAAALRTMPLWNKIDGISVLRPFMQISRQEITDWVKHYNLAFCEDPSNQSLYFLRNRLRKGISPLLYKEGLDPVKLWMNFHSQSLATADLGTPKTLIRSLKRKSPLEYIDLDRRLLGMALPLKMLLDAYLMYLGCSPASRSFLEELQRQLTRGPEFRLSYKCKQFYLWSDRRGPLWLFRQNAAALRPFQACLLDQDKGEFEVYYNHIKRRIILAKNERLLPFQEGMRVPLGKGSKKLKKIFQEIGLPLPIRRNIPLIWNADLSKVSGILLSFWEGGRDRRF